MRDTIELKEIYVNSVHQAIEEHFEEFIELSEQAMQQTNIDAQLKELGTKLRDTRNQELTKEEQEYIKQNMNAWLTDKELNHEFMRHIFQKLLNNKERIIKKN